MTRLAPRLLLVGSLTSLAITTSLVVLDTVAPPTAHAAAVSIASLPTDNPANWTPDVLDGQVESIWQVGDRIVIGGSFTQVANATSNGGAVYARSGLASFNASTGVVDPSFAPVLSGPVEVVIPSADGASVYVGGDFNTVNGVNRRKLARINLADGSLVSSFNANGINGLVRDARLVDGRIYIAGLFTVIAGQGRSYLASLDATTGAVTNDVNLAISGRHNGGTSKVINMEITPDASRMIIIGNFTSIDGQPRDQIALVDIGAKPAVLSPWRTDFFTSTCASVFDSFLRDVDIATDGSYAIATTTGAYRANTSCDTISRLELTAEQAGITPTWVSYTGGDTSYAVEIHDGVAYVGGHMRWVNNPYAADRHGAGGIAREGMAALDVVTGLPYSWNPGRTRGVGLFDYHVTQQGIWAGSDTDRWNNERHQRLAFFPWAGGSQVLRPEIGDLPNDVFQLGRTSGTTGSVDPSVLYRINAGGPTLASADDGPDWLGDTSSSSAYRNTGSSTSTAPSSLSTPRNDATVPKGDLDRPPVHLWTTERYDASGGNEMQWNLPVPAGTQIQVRLYLANRATSTDEVGERIFDVDLDGVTVIDDLDLTGHVGHDIGTMRSFDIVSDGSVTILFRHGAANNPLVNGIEIVRRDVTPGGTLGTQDGVVQHQVSPTGTPSGTVPVTSTVPWRTVRGAFTADSTLYTLHADGSIMRRTVDGSTFGQGIAIDMWSNDVMADMANMTGIFYDPDTSRIYYTLSGQSSLYSRVFVAESHSIGAARTTISGTTALNPSRVRGMFLGQGRLWFADSTSGNLLSMPYANGTVSGTPTVADTTVDWRSRALFRSAGAQANVLPTAAFTASCAQNECSFDGGSSSDPDGSIASYSWNFGDGATAAGREAAHSFAAGGQYTVTLTVTDDRGGTAQVQNTVTVADPPNGAPTAGVTVACDQLTCTFDSSTSSDGDGTIVARSWAFGDGTTGAGVTAQHAYSADGTYHAVLTVTDDDGAVGTASVDVQVFSGATAAVHRATASANSTTANASVVVPAAVQAGDQLIYIVTANANVGITAPAGWTTLGTRQDGSPDMVSSVFTRTADASTAGTTVTAVLSSSAKASRMLVAYDNAAAPTTLSSSVLGATSNQLSAPSATVPYAGSAVVGYWADKSSGNTGWTLPASMVQRGQSVGSGSGRITAALGDASIPAGTWPGATATSTVSGTKGIAWTIVVPPATGNIPPVASFTQGCSSLTCLFDAGASGDADGSVVSYDWTFGNGTSGSGVNPSVTYGSDGTFAVTLTVTDDRGATSSTTANVTVSLAVVTFSGAASNNQNVASPSVTVPTSVATGDQLVLFLTTNSATTAATPAGWTLLDVVSAGSPDVRSWAFTRTAVGSTAGSTVQVALGSTAKSSLVVMAYRGAAPITTAIATTSTGASTSLAVSPIGVAVPGSVVVAYWADKTSGNTGWTVPGSVIERADSPGSGSGRITAVGADVAVGSGTWPGAIATSGVSSSKAIGWTVLVPAG